MLFVDTSALFALLTTNEEHHDPAREWFARARRSSSRLLTHSYVVLESTILVRSRIGPSAVRPLLEELMQVIDTVYVDEGLHRASVAAYLARPGGPSLVDRVSFQLMRDLGIRQAFAFDEDFRHEGFETVP